MDKPRAYVEHPEHGLKMIYLEEREEYLSKGWNRPGQKPVEVVEEENDSHEQPQVPEYDANGYPWDGRINLKDRSVTKKGTWRILPGVKKKVQDAVRAEIKPPETSLGDEDGGDDDLASQEGDE